MRFALLSILGLLIGGVAVRIIMPARVIDSPEFVGFPVVWIGEEASAITAIKNVGKHPIEIGSVVASCACTSASCDRTRIGPGESGSIELKLRGDTTMYSGQMVASVQISITEQDTGRDVSVMLPVIIEELRGVTVTPKVVSLGNIVKNVDASVYVTVFGLADADIDLQASSTVSWIDVHVEEMDVHLQSPHQHKREWKVRMSAMPQGYTGSIEGALILVLKARDSKTPIHSQRITVYGDVIELPQ